MPTLDTDTIVMFAAVTALLAVLLIIKLIAFFYEYNKETQYIRIEMNETADEKERRFWHQKLVYHRLCLIPFVTERNVERVYAMFHHGRHARKEQKSIVRVFAPLILGLSVCLVSLSGLTYAWFTATLQGSAQTIRAATFCVDVTVTNTDTSEAVTQTKNKDIYTVELAANQTYAFKMKASQDNTASRGFCKIVVTDNGKTAGTPYYTATFSNTESYTIQVTPEKNMTVMVESIWGEVEKQLPKVTTVKNNESIGSKAPATVSKTTTTTRTTATTTKSAAAKTYTTTAAPTTTTTTTTSTTTTATQPSDADDES